MIHRLDLARPTTRSPTAPAKPTGDALLQLTWTAVGVALFVLVLVAGPRPPPPAALHVHDRRHRDLFLLLPLVPGIGVEMNGAQHLDPVRRAFVPARRARQDRPDGLLRGLPRRQAGRAGAGRQAVPRASTCPAARDLGPILVVWAASLGILIFETRPGHLAAVLRRLRDAALRRDRAALVAALRLRAVLRRRLLRVHAVRPRAAPGGASGSTRSPTRPGYQISPVALRPRRRRAARHRPRRRAIPEVVPLRQDRLHHHRDRRGARARPG